MKKLISLLLVLMLTLGIAASAEVQPLPEVGLTVDLPDDYADQNITLNPAAVGGLAVLTISFINMTVLAPLSDEVKNAIVENDEAKVAELQTAFAEAYNQHVADYYDVVGLETSRMDELCSTYNIDLEGATQLGTNSTHTYFLLKGQENEALSEEDRALMEAGQPLADKLVASISITEIKAGSAPSDEELVAGLTSFSTVDMNGNTVTQELFAQADLTVLNIWGTYCSPCIGEMPELAEWANEMPEGVQLVGLIVDVPSTSDKNYAKAEKILSKSGCTFTNLLYNDSLASLVSEIVGTPTTLFIDRNGNVAHEQIVGADINGYKTAVEDILAK